MWKSTFMGSQYSLCVCAFSILDQLINFRGISYNIMPVEDTPKSIFFLISHNQWEQHGGSAIFRAGNDNSDTRFTVKK
jgi:hypothetical protein